MPGAASFPCVFAGEFRQARPVTKQDGSPVLTSEGIPLANVFILAMSGQREVPLSITIRSDKVNGTQKGEWVVIPGRVAINEKGYSTAYGDELHVGRVQIPGAKK